MSNSTFELGPKSKTRYNAGEYDPETFSPKYEIKVAARDDIARSQVEINQILMGNKGSRIWVWDITNNSTWPIFISIMKDGVLVKR
ncbi:TPA: hypothetical protein GRI96_24895 [Vibrio parahaemolyticus]|uniref:hypothetical protein n=1 Tax=Vibrio parahaemolyticus TaxID=670 RepID=UPI00064B43F0|nr:hypothetical protein [Vibrio parahaemolyticus]EGR1985722.1 hypothetical protein [Vibrio parahaemolyticus]EHH2570948.1 hypothetical protein [Vibrio parahaemolyticus]EII3443200.1 hypothetical protein [Vibrio parahaemolyticus]EJG0711701.1 hypothetical protein [Vibrio parahaemolyticus]ELA7843101.1 hypothetical protein [Vibrio parahaemolyticus]